VTTKDYQKLRAQGGDTAVLRALNPSNKKSRLEQLMDEEEGSQGEQTLAFHLKHSSLPAYAREFEFAKSEGRNWRFDVAWPELMVAVEVDGVMWDTQGRHQRPDHLAEQNNKQNTATALGWRVYRFTTAQVLSGHALETLEWAFKRQGLAL
jgi:very-short-patch-repair endonuclease